MGGKYCYSAQLSYLDFLTLSLLTAFTTVQTTYYIHWVESANNVVTGMFEGIYTASDQWRLNYVN